VVGPVRVSFLFRFKRPKSHYRTGRNAHILKDDAPQFHTQTPDLDKLIRSTQAALSSVVWRDDSQVCKYGRVEKQWAEDGIEGADVIIELLDDDEVTDREQDMIAT